MKDWEQAAILTDVLDRHMAHLTKHTGPADWTIHWSLPAFLRLLWSEPILAALIMEYVGEYEGQLGVLIPAFDALATRATRLFTERHADLQSLRPELDPQAWEHIGFDKFSGGSPSLDPSVALQSLRHWIEFNYGDPRRLWTAPKAADVSPELERLSAEMKALDLRADLIRQAMPGGAYDHLVGKVVRFTYSTGDSVGDRVHNENVEKLHRWIREYALFGQRPGEPDQYEVTRIQRATRTLHLALVTSLAHGRSRWAMVRRFAARCESFDRDQLLRAIELDAEEPGRGKPEAVLTLAFARYLFDAGFNPLVDAAACGLRPDVLDPTNQPAVYVEAKQYADVGPAFTNGLRGDLAQTLNTWGRLAKRWWTPEAFLLIFRRSGRPIEIDQPGVSYLGRRLYVLVVDLGAPNESGSRAMEPVRVSLPDLMPKPSP